MRRASWLGVGIALIAVLVVVIAHVRHQRDERATVPKVSAAALDAPERADHVAVGDRRFDLARFALGGGTVVQATAADAEGLNDGTAVRVQSRPSARGGDVQLSWLGEDAGRLRVRFVRDGHQVVLTGWPATEAVRRAMSRLAAR